MDTYAEAERENVQKEMAAAMHRDDGRRAT